MTNSAISVSSLSKNFRLYHERNRYIKAALLRGRRAKYEEFWALKDVSFEVAHGATLGIIGSNGSGKTTMLKCLTGIYTPEKGMIKVDGKLAALLELGAGFHPELTGAENIFLNGSILGMSKRDVQNKFASIVEFAGLEKFINTPVKNFSSGMVVRLGFSIASHVEPEILLIDEILSVGDQDFQRKSSEKIEEFRREGRTIVVVSHSLGLVQQLCKEVIWLDKGQIRQSGPAAEVIAAYTGGSYQPQTDRDESSRNRWGTGDARINSIELLNHDETIAQVIESNAGAQIRFQISAHTRIESPILRVQITRLNGDVVWATSTQRGTNTMRVLDGPATATLNIESTKLLEGTYFVSASITDSTGTTEFDHCENWLRFNVHKTNVFDEGIVAINSTWSLERHHR
ncbi:MAG: ABC transporter ATP-binding protein [Ilumatobacteraceae bacterium]|jgi:ABC-type polysaccharide/polyol phosphate transport system ATPase subunit|nr:ABC transporter ATP-binding protein [Ilumatobacteraceae bacterium]HBZ62311.1 ABC transporter ATP-binding protein [Acidimicrobium sp.]MDP4695625.1 ABC transporter ATP-binding protein [Ilumatobacteraceae bacterium]MDP4736530.1 ABC transporter ATP-binding protein [Ilumatobacteraceae bacterium]MDP4902552.1 ABC transporter ATP-binding protein [Ilumatobacteraceae bacterium]